MFMQYVFTGVHHTSVLIWTLAHHAQFQAIILPDHLERKHLERTNSDKEGNLRLVNSTDGIRPTHGR